MIFWKNTIKVEIIQNGHDRSSVLIIGNTAAVIDVTRRVFQHLNQEKVKKYEKMNVTFSATCAQNPVQ